MAEDQINLVGTLGLLKHEVCFIKIMLGLTAHARNSRAQGRYVWTEDLKNAKVVIVGAGDDAVMQEWRSLSAGKTTATLLLVSESEQYVGSKYHISRPFGPAKILMLLDRIVQDRQSVVVEADTFSGNVNAVQREFLRTAKTVAAARFSALVVDDSPTVRKQLVLELGSFNIRVDTAETGEQGLEMLEKGRYDIIFLDVVMPGADGYQVCKIIRRNQNTKLTPVVMLTSKSSPFDKVRGSLAGCSSYLTKPVDYENFYHVLEQFLEHTTGSGLVKK